MTAMAERRITGKHVLIGLIAFFGVVIAVNGVFTWFALDSWTGLAVEHSYQRGLAYNDELAAAERQRALGWRSGVRVAAAENAEGGREVTVEMQGAGGAPLTGLGVTVTFLRPTHEGLDRTATAEETAPGVYTARLALPRDGRWNVELDVRAGNDRRYRMTHEVFVKP